MYSAAEIMTSLMADDKPAVAKRCRNRRSDARCCAKGEEERNQTLNALDR